jgi:hypothetical protein
LEFPPHARLISIENIVETPNSELMYRKKLLVSNRQEQKFNSPVAENYEEIKCTNF